MTPLQLLLVALVASTAYADPFFHHKKAALLGAPLFGLKHHAPESRIIEKTVEVIKPVEVIKEVPVIRNVEVIKEVPVIRTVEKPVEVIKHVPVVRTVVQRVAVPYPVHIERRVPYAVHVERHIPVPVTVERLHTPISTRTAPYPEPLPLPEPEIVPEPHPLAAKLDHLLSLKGHSIKKRSPILKKIKAKIHAKKNFVKGGFKKIFG